MNYLILTNNPVVAEKYRHDKDVLYEDVGFIELLKLARDMVHKSYKLLSHPLSGSVKPTETPYKSVMLTKHAAIDMESLVLIENAIAACGKFDFSDKHYSDKAYEDFRLIDYTLIRNAVESADAQGLQGLNF